MGTAVIHFNPRPATQRSNVIKFPTPSWSRPAKWRRDEGHDADGQVLGMTHKEIAEVLGCTPQRVQQIEAAGLAKLQRECERIGLGVEDLRR